MHTFRTGIGQDSHRFLPKLKSKPCIIAGLLFTDTPGMDADSDGDVVFHAICNAISSLTHVPILGRVAIDLCKSGITDSKVYVIKALETMQNKTIIHVAVTIEGKRPVFQPRHLEMRQSIASVMQIKVDQVGMAFTSGDQLTSFGCGEGLLCFCIITTREG